MGIFSEFATFFIGMKKEEQKENFAIRSLAMFGKPEISLRRLAIEIVSLLSLGAMLSLYVLR